MNKRWRVAAVAGTVFLGTGLFYGIVLRPTLQRGMQVRNLEDLRSYKRAIDAYHEQTGQFPLGLADAVAMLGAQATAAERRGLDNWGNHVLYFPAGDQYVLISFGRDGRSDGSNYAMMRQDSTNSNEACRDFDADQVLSELGEHRTCGK